jgi:hypothetical protein
MTIYITVYPPIVTHKSGNGGITIIMDRFFNGTTIRKNMNIMGSKSTQMKINR